MDVTEEGFRLLAWSVSSSVTINVFPQELNTEFLSAHARGANSQLRS